MAEVVENNRETGSDIGQKTGIGIVWKTMEVVLKKIISTVVTIILARILSGEDYGIIALTTVFITFSNVFTQNGFGLALVREKNLEKRDISTALTSNLVFTSLLYCLIFVFAPYIAEFYKTELLCDVLRVISLTVIVQGFYSIPMSVCTRQMRFKYISISGTLSSALSCVAGVVLAYLGFGVWALVAQQLVMSGVDCILLPILSKFRISFIFSRGSFKKLIKFSVGSSAASLLDFAGNYGVSLLLGRAISVEQLGIYNKGVLLPELIGLNVFNIINATMLPALVASSSDKEHFDGEIKKFISKTYYIMLPIMLGLFLVSDQAIPVLLSDKWNAAIPVMEMYCLVYLVNPLRAFAYNAFYAKGQTSKSIIIEAVRAILMLTSASVVLYAMNGDIVTLSVAVAVVYSVVSLLSVLWLFLAYKIDSRDLLKEILDALILTVVMAICVCAVDFLPLGVTATLIVKILIGALIFVLMSVYTKNANFYSILGFLSVIKARIFKRKGKTE